MLVSKFGSRVDLFLPIGTPINVVLNQKQYGKPLLLQKHND
jgi:phosphatidylserine decarboxylase